MEGFTQIDEMEKILNLHNQKVVQLKDLIEELTAQSDDYKRLLDYYYSEQRQQDIENDKNNACNQWSKSVLDEDSIYDLISMYYDTSIKMLELSTKILKN